MAKDLEQVQEGSKDTHLADVKVTIRSEMYIPLRPIQRTTTDYIEQPREAPRTRVMNMEYLDAMT